MGTNRANEGVEVGNELPLGSFFSCFFFSLFPHMCFLRQLYKPPNAPLLATSNSSINEIKIFNEYTVHTVGPLFRTIVYPSVFGTFIRKKNYYK